jgi:hypothetical protein
MEEEKRQAYIARKRAELEQFHREEEERMEHFFAVARCDKCPQQKSEREARLELANGLRMWVSTTHCASPGVECTAVVHTHFTSETTEVANRITKGLYSQPELAALGVSFYGCLNGSDQLTLTYPAPLIAHVAQAAGSLNLDEFGEAS